MSGLVDLTVQAVDGCSLRIADGAWTYATQHAVSIDDYWQHALAANPTFFNGVIHVMATSPSPSFDTSTAGTLFTAWLVRTDFKSFLHWRDHARPATSTRDAFGSAILRSREGHVLLGRQRAGNINAGLAYLPGGFIDARDVDAAGGVDIAASITRELAEETGIDPADVTVLPGFRIIACGAQVAMAREYRSDATAQDLRTLIMSNLAQQVDSELCDIVIVAGPDDLAMDSMPAYTRLALRHVFSHTRP